MHAICDSPKLYALEVILDSLFYCLTMYVSYRTEVLSGTPRLVLGIFTVNQAYGMILAGQSQTISVDCTGERQGRYEEELSIEISDRHKDSKPIPYKIGCEVLNPGINTTDIALIFEEHRICRELGVLGQYQFHEDNCVGVYGEREKKFVFKGVIVGQMSKARFKISNPNKVKLQQNYIRAVRE